MNFRQDITHAARLLWRSPLFTLIAVLSLAIGIAGNAMVFSVADAIFMRARPGIGEPQRVVDISRLRNGNAGNNFSHPDYVDYRDRNTQFEGIAAYREAPIPLGLGQGAGSGAERIYGGQISANYLDVLRVPMAAGRNFSPAEDRDGASVTILNYDTWQRRFEGDPAVVGRTIYLNRIPYTVIGVAGQGFAGNLIFVNDLWIPLAAPIDSQGPRRFDDRRATWLQAIGRLKPGVSIEQGRADLQQIARALEQEYPQTNRGNSAALNTSTRIAGFSGTAAVIGFVALLFSLVGLILLIACTNVGSMLMARGAARTREIATRLALGAARGQIIGGLIIESLLLGVIGVVLGLAGALVLVAMLRALLPALPLPITLDFRVDWRVMTFSIVISLAAGLIAGLVPALQASRTALLTAMRQDAWSRSVSRLRRGFVVAQVAMSMLLVVCAILFSRALTSAAQVDPGFAIPNLDVVSLEFRLGGYDEGGGQRFAEDILPRIEALPEVTAAAFSRVLPLSGSGVGLGPLWRPGQPRQDETATWVEWNVVTGNYFGTLGVPLRRGRSFSPADTAGAPRVAVVSESFATRVWPGQDPIGQTLINRRGDTDRELTVVGVVADAQLGNLSDELEPLIYVAGAQDPEAQGWLLIRTTGQSSLPAVRRLLAEIDPNLPIVETSTLEQVAALTLTPNRIAAWLAGAVGIIGLFLATLGIYGITAFSVSQRTREIGVRVALGAVAGDVFRLVVSGGMRLALVGIALGAVAAAAAAQLLTGLLYGVAPIDPVSFLGGTVLFAAAAFLASLVPAMRAAGLNPVDALRSE